MGAKRKAIPSRTKATLQREIGSQCPFCQSVDVEHFEVHHMDGDPSNNVVENLFMLCQTCHSKITKGDISPTEVLGVKTTLTKPVVFEKNVTQTVVGNNNWVTYHAGGTPKPKYPAGSIGSDTVKANYVSYLIDRYGEFKEYEVGKGNVQHGPMATKFG